MQGIALALIQLLSQGRTRRGGGHGSHVTFRQQEAEAKSGTEIIHVKISQVGLSASVHGTHVLQSGGSPTRFKAYLHP